MAHTIRMVRQGEAPNTADVHPDEVENFAADGWTVDDSAPAEPAPAKAEAPAPTPAKPAAKRPARKAAK